MLTEEQGVDSTRPNNSDHRIELINLDDPGSVTSNRLSTVTIRDVKLTEFVGDSRECVDSKIVGDEI